MAVVVGGRPPAPDIPAARPGRGNKADAPEVRQAVRLHAEKVAAAVAPVVPLGDEAPFLRRTAPAYERAAVAAARRTGVAVANVVRPVPPDGAGRTLGPARPPKRRGQTGDANDRPVARRVVTSPEASARVVETVPARGLAPLAGRRPPSPRPPQVVATPTVDDGLAKAGGRAFHTPHAAKGLSPEAIPPDAVSDGVGLPVSPTPVAGLVTGLRLTFHGTRLVGPFRQPRDPRPVPHTRRDVGGDGGVDALVPAARTVGPPRQEVVGLGADEAADVEDAVGRRSPGGPVVGVTAVVTPAPARLLGTRTKVPDVGAIAAGVAVEGQGQDGPRLRRPVHVTAVRDGPGVVDEGVLAPSVANGVLGRGTGP